MPRPNKAREVYAEEHVAERIAAERDARGWTNDGLAKRMTDAGCAMTGSAIFKIEKGQPRRRITVDELVGFSRVFGMSVEQLLADPVLWNARRLVPLLEDYRRNEAERIEAMQRHEERERELRQEIQSAADEFPETRDFLADWFKDHGSTDSTWAERVLGTSTPGA